MARLDRATPAALGFRMPAEWEPHEATWIAWPHEISDWPGKFDTIPWVYGEVVRRLSQVERVRILIREEQVERARRVLRKAGANLPAVEFFSASTDRSWTRDYCPIFVKNAGGGVAATDWRFNGWAKYPNHESDEAAGALVARRSRLRLWRPNMVLEGGSIDVNGAGTLLTTEECLLSDVQARNPGRSKEEIEGALGEYLGVRKVLWLKNGIAGDDTHGHVDDLARFVDARTVVIGEEADPSDANYQPLRENIRLLRTMTDQNGQRLRVVSLPMPGPLHFEGQRLPASYCNFYIANEVVLVPTFNDPNDRIALNILARLFPARNIIGIHSVDLVLGLGTLHCMTMQEPIRA
jgi:agmatine deiminase